MINAINIINNTVIHKDSKELLEESRQGMFESLSGAKGKSLYKLTGEVPSYLLTILFKIDEIEDENSYLKYIIDAKLDMILSNIIKKSIISWLEKQDIKYKVNEYEDEVSHTMFKKDNCETWFMSLGVSTDMTLDDKKVVRVILIPHTNFLVGDAEYLLTELKKEIVAKTIESDKREINKVVPVVEVKDKTKEVFENKNNSKEPANKNDENFTNVDVQNIDVLDISLENSEVLNEGTKEKLNIQENIANISANADNTEPLNEFNIASISFDDEEKKDNGIESSVIDITDLEDFSESTKISNEEMSNMLEQIEKEVVEEKKYLQEKETEITSVNSNINIIDEINNIEKNIIENLNIEDNFTNKEKVKGATIDGRIDDNNNNHNNNDNDSDNDDNNINIDSLFDDMFDDLFDEEDFSETTNEGNEINEVDEVNVSNTERADLTVNEENNQVDKNSSQTTPVITVNNDNNIVDNSNNSSNNSENVQNDNKNEKKKKLANPINFDMLSNLKEVNHDKNDVSETITSEVNVTDNSVDENTIISPENTIVAESITETVVETVTETVAEHSTENTMEFSDRHEKENNSVQETHKIQETQEVQEVQEVQENTLKEVSKDTDSIDKNVSTYFASKELEKYNVYSEFELTELEQLWDQENPEYVCNIPTYFDNVRTATEKETLKEIIDDVAYYQTVMNKSSFMRSQTNDYPIETFKKDASRILKEKHPDLAMEDKPVVDEMLNNLFYGYNILTDIINNEDVSDIKVLYHDKINAKIKGKHYTVNNITFRSKQDYEIFVEALFERNGVDINKPIAVFTDTDFHEDYILRFNICLPYINSSDEPYLHIRKVPKRKTTMIDLINAKMLPPNVASWLVNKAKTAKGIVFSGPSASGKTTLMNAMLEHVDKTKSVLAIQESEELFSYTLPNIMFQHITRGYDLDAIGTNGLLCDAGYFIIGEIKGKEARTFIRSANTGHMCWCSVHSASAKASLPRLADYVKYGSDYSFADALKMLVDLEVLIYIEDFKVKQIDVVKGFDLEKNDLIYETVYRI